MIIFRYLAKEIYAMLLAVTAVLLFVFLSNQIIRYLNYAATGKIAASILVHLISLQVPYLTGLLLPMGLFFGVLFALSRMYVDSEMTILFSAGYSKAKLIATVFLLALVVAIVTGILTLWVNPMIAMQKDILSKGGGGTDAIFNTIMPGRFQTAANNKMVFYVQSVTDNRQHIQNFFMAEKPDVRPATNQQQIGSGWSVVSAQGASQISRGDGDSYVVAHDGNRYQGIPGHKDYFLVHFKQYGVKLFDMPSSIPLDDVSAKPTSLLFLTSLYNSDDMAELQWRFSIPIAALLLALLAVPLSKVNPRQGKYAQFLPAVLICLFYINMLFVMRAWLQDGRIPAWIGLWPVHLVLLVMIAVFLWVQSLRQTS